MWNGPGTSIVCLIIELLSKHLHENKNTEDHEEGQRSTRLIVLRRICTEQGFQDTELQLAADEYHSENCRSQWRELVAVLMALWCLLGLTYSSSSSCSKLSFLMLFTYFHCIWYVILLIILTVVINVWSMKSWCWLCCLWYAYDSVIYRYFFSIFMQFCYGWIFLLLLLTNWLKLNWIIAKYFMNDVRPSVLWLLIGHWLKSKCYLRDFEGSQGMNEQLCLYVLREWFI